MILILVSFPLEILDLHAVGVMEGSLMGNIRYALQAFWDDFPSGRMDKEGFVRYYEEIKDENDKTGILCEYESSPSKSNLSSLWSFAVMYSPYSIEIMMERLIFMNFYSRWLLVHREI